MAEGQEKSQPITAPSTPAAVPITGICATTKPTGNPTLSFHSHQLRKSAAAPIVSTKPITTQPMRSTKPRGPERVFFGVTSLFAAGVSGVSITFRCHTAVAVNHPDLRGMFDRRPLSPAFSETSLFRTRRRRLPALPECSSQWDRTRRRAPGTVVRKPGGTADLRVRR